MGRKSEQYPCECSKCAKKCEKVCREEVTCGKQIDRCRTKEILHITKVNVCPKLRIVHKYKKVYVYQPEEVEEVYSDCEKVDVKKCKEKRRDSCDRDSDRCANKEFNKY